MTDEEEEERRAIEAMMARKRARGGYHEVAAVIGEDKEKINQEVINEDLEQLIKANGDDIEYEFFLNGELIAPNQTIYEVLRQADQRAKKAREQA